MQINRRLTGKIVLELTITLQHFHLLLVVEAAEELSLLDHVLLSFLQEGSANHAGKALEMEDALLGTHHELIGGDFMATAKATIA